MKLFFRYECYFKCLCQDHNPKRATKIIQSSAVFYFSALQNNICNIGFLSTCVLEFQVSSLLC